MKTKFKKVITFYEDDQERVLINLGDLPCMIDYIEKTQDLDAEFIEWYKCEIGALMMVALQAEIALDELVLIKMTEMGLVLCQEEVREFYEGLKKKYKEELLWV